MRWRKLIEQRLAALEALEQGDRALTSVWTDVPPQPQVPEYLSTSMQLAFGGFEGYVEDQTEEQLPGVYL